MGDARVSLLGRIKMTALWSITYLIFVWDTGRVSAFGGASMTAIRNTARFFIFCGIASVPALLSVVRLI